MKKSFQVVGLFVLPALYVFGPSALVHGQEEGTVVVDPLTGQATVQEPPAEETPPPTRADLSEVNELVRNSRWAEADTALAALQEEFPEDARVLLMRGEVLLTMRNPDQALPLLERSAELDGEKERVHFQLAAARQMTGDLEGAIEAYGKELELNDDDAVQVMARLNRSVLFEQTRDLKAAAAELQAVLELEPGRTEIYGDIATLSIQAGRLDEAGEQLRKGVEAGYRSARHFYILGARYYEKKMWEPAVEAFGQALEIDPTLAEAERSLGSSLDQMGRGRDAVVHLKRYLELKPDAPDSAKVSERIRALEP